MGGGGGGPSRYRTDVLWFMLRCLFSSGKSVNGWLVPSLGLGLQTGRQPNMDGAGNLKGWTNENYMTRKGRAGMLLFDEA